MTASHPELKTRAMKERNVRKTQMICDTDHIDMQMKQNNAQAGTSSVPLQLCVASSYAQTTHNTDALSLRHPAAAWKTSSPSVTYM